MIQSRDIQTPVLPIKDPASTRYFVPITYSTTSHIVGKVLTKSHKAQTKPQTKPDNKAQSDNE